MTTVAFDAVLGPQSRGSLMPYPGALDDYYALDDFNDSVAWRFVIPSNGTITEVGFYSSWIQGSPPRYNVGLLPIQPASGFPVAYGTHYGGSSLESTQLTLGWNWITLTTPATAQAGNLASVAVVPLPSGTPPNGSNYVGICVSPIYQYTYNYIPEIITFGTAWSVYAAGFGAFAVKYNDGSVYGFPISEFINTSIISPAEAGCKFTLPFNVSCVGSTLSVYETNAQQKALKISLYDNNDTVLRSITFLDSDEVFRNTSGVGNFLREFRWSSPVTLNKDTVYRLTYQNLTTYSGMDLDGIKFVNQDSKNSNFFNYINEWGGTYRTASGTWTDDDLVVYDMGIIVESVTIEATASGVTTVTLGGSYAYVS